MSRYGTSYSTQIALESFQAIMMDQEPKDRIGYVDKAMEAIATPDAGMVLDRIYQSAMVRANINFGKVPESQGDLTKFTRYRTIAENLNLLLRQLGEYNIYEVELTKKLHDDIVKLREDFEYGYKVDSMFLKTTYQTLVFQLCEMIDLCDCIYIEALKAGAEAKPFKPTNYKDLLLVQNVAKFTKMVDTGEWAQTVTGIKKDARNLMIQIDSNGDDSATRLLQGIFGSGIATITGSHVLRNAKEAAKTAGVDKITGTMLRDAMWKNNSKLGRAGVVITGIIAAVFLMRYSVFLFYKVKYGLNDMLDDAEFILKEHMDRNDVAGISAGRERQKWLYDKLAARHDKMVKGIMDNERTARQNMKDSNANDFRPQANSGSSSADIEIS